MITAREIFKDKEHGFCFECGAGNGGHSNPSHRVLTEQSWHGLLVECDKQKFAELAVRCSRQSLASIRITPYNIYELLTAYDVPRDLDWFILDIDSYDRAIMESVFSGGFRPKVLTLEMNEKIPYPVRFSVNYKETHEYSGGHFYGVSFACWEEVLQIHGYTIVGVENENLHAVHTSSDVANRHAISCAGVWENLVSIFAKNADYNADVIHWCDAATPMDAYRMIQTYFDEKGIGRDRYELSL